MYPRMFTARNSTVPVSRVGLWSKTGHLARRIVLAVFDLTSAVVADCCVQGSDSVIQLFCS